MPKPKPFSQRAGIVSPRTAIQRDSLDAITRTALWNSFFRHFLTDFTNSDYFTSTYEFGRTFTALWTDYFHEPIDNLEYESVSALDHLHEYFFSSASYEVFDLLEFVIALYAYPEVAQQFALDANAILERELCGYRLLDGLFTKVTSDPELQAIEAALQSTYPLDPVHLHLRDALAKLSDRKSPDFRNSIKEAVSAVEALSRTISGKPKGTLGDALTAIEKQAKIQIHSALKNGFSSIYGWTSDAQGIRHALLDEPTLTFDDANFMLVSCSAFVSYLLSKCADSGISLTPTS